MHEDTKEIESIIFGILSPDEIIKMSVCKIINTKLTGPGSVYDERMGSNTETNTPCVTCEMSTKECPGHFGYIELNEYIIHPLFYKYVVSFLRCFCIQCNRLLITEDQIGICGLDRYKSERRFEKVLEKLEKVDVCCHCDSPQPKIVYTITDNSIAMVYKESVNTDEDGNSIKKRDNKISIALSVDEIKKLFDPILDEDVKLCGFEPSRMHPRNLILSVFPVIPPCARPFVLADGNICDDDLTNQIMEIIKMNNLLKQDDSKDSNDEKQDIKKQKIIQSLKFRISTFYNNSQGKAKHPTNGRPIKGIKERITGKEGQIRTNLMGKRVNYSGRTVIGPDPNLPFGWMAIPKEISEELTRPEKVCSFNKDYLENLVNNGKANFVIKTNGTKLNLKYSMFLRGTELFPTDIIIRGDNKIPVKENITLCIGDKLERDGKILGGVIKGDTVIRGEEKIQVKNSDFLIKYGDKIERQGEIIKSSDILLYPSKKYIKLEFGDEVHRHLKEGDLVLLNRQPTLHKGSMLAMKIKIISGKTFRMNLATCKSFNADK
jgi:DNA-directed RNA polymerase beta' subunit